MSPQDSDRRRAPQPPGPSIENQKRRDYLRILQECQAEGARFHRHDSALRRRIRREAARIQRELAPLQPHPVPKSAPRSIHRRQHRRQHRGRATDPDDEADDDSPSVHAPLAAIGEAT